MSLVTLCTAPLISLKNVDRTIGGTIGGTLKANPTGGDISPAPFQFGTLI